jgi:hypothetical protein
MILMKRKSQCTGPQADYKQIANNTSTSQELSQEKYQESRRHHDLHVLVGSFEVRIPITGMRLRAARPCTPEALELYVVSKVGYRIKLRACSPCWLQAGALNENLALTDFWISAIPLNGLRNEAAFHVPPPPPPPCLRFIRDKPEPSASACRYSRTFKHNRG